MEPGGSLPHSQVPATCHYPVPARSNPCPTHPFCWRSILILSSHLRLGLPNILFPSGFPTKTLYTPLLSPYTLHAPPISFVSILSPEKIGWGLQIIKLSIMQFSPLPLSRVTVILNVFWKRYIKMNMTVISDIAHRLRCLQITASLELSLSLFIYKIFCSFGPRTHSTEPVLRRALSKESFSITRHYLVLCLVLETNSLYRQKNVYTFLEKPCL